jgi:hypothetical protein
MCCQPDTRAVGFAPTRLLSYQMTKDLSATSTIKLLRHPSTSPLYRFPWNESHAHIMTGMLCRLLKSATGRRCQKRGEFTGTADFIEQFKDLSVIFLEIARG